MDDHINKTELSIMVDVTAKNVAQLERVSNSLSSIVELQKEIQKCLCDNREMCPVKIISHCEKHWLAEKEQHKDIQDKVSGLKSEILWIKLLTGGLCSVLAIAKVVSEFVR